MASNSSQDKGKKVDWKATAEMTTTTWMTGTSDKKDAADAPQDRDKGKGKGVDWHATAEMLSTTPDRDPEVSLRQEQEKKEEEEAATLAATIKLLFELDEREVAKANHIRFSSRGTARQAPPPPAPVVRMIWPKMENSDRAGAYAGEYASNDEAVGFDEDEDEDEDEDVDMVDATPPPELMALREPVPTMPLRSVKRKKNFLSAPVRLGRLESGPELVVADEASEDRWECHEV